PLEVLYDQWEDRLDALLLVVPAKRARGRDKGDFSVSEGQARRGGDLVYTGAQMIRPERAMEIDEEVFSLNLVWNRLIARGTLKLCEYPGSWMDIGTPEGLSDANAMAATKSG
ncbi:MAG: nucleotidyltransferase family protein, partial [Pseudomonadota bacterium]